MYSCERKSNMKLDLPADTTFDDYLKNCNEVVYSYLHISFDGTKNNKIKTIEWR